MARGKKNSTLGSGVEINMTPMIDCTFLLIVFFILTAQILKAELVEMVVPKVTNAQVAEKKKADDGNELIIQAKSAQSGKKVTARAAELAQNGYRVGGVDFANSDLKGIEDAITQRILVAKDKGYEAYKIIVRADARLQYRFVYQLMLSASQAAAKAGGGIEVKTQLTSLRPSS